jgi:hypothetical protein
MVVRPRHETASLILCAGKASRIGGFPKQLLPVSGGELFIQRIVRQVRERGGRPFVITRNEQIRKSGGAPSYDPGPTDYTVETFGATCHLWAKRTHILLGDVCYSRDCMDRIFRFDGDVAIWGDRWEIYGASFSIDQFKRVMRAIDAVLFDDQSPPSVANLLYVTTGCDPTPYVPRDDPGRGKMRRFYQAIANIPFGNTLEKEILQVVGSDDYTRDVDTLEDYSNFRMEVLWGGRLDDE